MDDSRDERPLLRERDPERGTGQAPNPPDHIPKALRRTDPPDLPDVPEPQLVRHYHQLSRRSFGVDTGPYLLGSCTMKYNPRLNERIAGLPGYSAVHPRMSDRSLEGWLEVAVELRRRLLRLVGLEEISLLPAAGAQGEWVGLRVIGAFHRANGDENRRDVLIPDSAHGTNPASANLCGFDAVEVESNDRGRVKVEDLKRKLSERTAALMLTNPNTLGLFENDIMEIQSLVHEVGGRLYYDGANLNALVGRVRPGSMGFDVVHLNLHKTFSTPHGSGGPGAGPVAFSRELAPYRPVPRLEQDGDRWVWADESDRSIGRIRSFQGNMGVLVRALAYIQRMGETGLERVSADSVLAANYLRKKMPDELPPSHEGPCQHEFVVSCEDLPVKAGEFAKRLIDFGVHPPTVYFPLVVPEALMIEPTETLSKRELDRVAEVFGIVTEEALEDPETVRTAPHSTPIRQPDEAQAARDPRLTWDQLD